MRDPGRGTRIPVPRIPIPDPDVPVRSLHDGSEAGTLLLSLRVGHAWRLRIRQNTCCWHHPRRRPSSRDLWKTTGVTLDRHARPWSIPTNRARGRGTCSDSRFGRDEGALHGREPGGRSTGTPTGRDRARVLALLREEGAASSFLRSHGVTIEIARAAAAMAESPLAG